MKPNKELALARKEAYSLKPGLYPWGVFLGEEKETDGSVYRYYKSDAGGYFYTSSTTDQVEADIQAHRQKGGTHGHIRCRF